MKIKATLQINVGMLLAFLLGIQDQEDNHKIKGEVASLSLKVLGTLDPEVKLQIGEEQLKWKWKNLFTLKSRALPILHNRWSNCLN